MYWRPQFLITPKPILFPLAALSLTLNQEQGRDIVCEVFRLLCTVFAVFTRRYQFIPISLTRQSKCLPRLEA